MRPHMTLRPILIGDDPNLAKQWGAVVVALLVVPLTLTIFGYYPAVYSIVPPRVVNYAGSLGVVLLAAAQAYQNRGVIVSLLLCIAPASAWTYDVITNMVPSPGSLFGAVLFSIGGGVVIGIPLGILGILLGYASIWIISSNRSGLEVLPFTNRKS